MPQIVSIPGCSPLRSARLWSFRSPWPCAPFSFRCYNAASSGKGGPMFQPDLLKGRAIFLTGGGSGLGRSMALHFARLGARMFLIGRREQPLRDACAEIHGLGGSAAFSTCDVREYAAVESAFAAAEDHFGEIDSLVNNAAGNFMARTEKLSANAFSSVVGIV